ncbi:hypothetical protein O9992_22835 [Vibrio lentus]|nr:hypothetical protein [Vibrio lentus]
MLDKALIRGSISPNHQLVMSQLTKQLLMKMTKIFYRNRFNTLFYQQDDDPAYDVDKYCDLPLSFDWPTGLLRKILDPCLQLLLHCLTIAPENNFRRSDEGIHKHCGLIS